MKRELIDVSHRSLTLLLVGKLFRAQIEENVKEMHQKSIFAVFGSDLMNICGKSWTVAQE